MPDRNKRHPHKGNVVAETEKAYKFEPDKGEAIWLPKSQCTWEDKDFTMWIPLWLEKEKDIN